MTSFSCSESSGTAENVRLSCCVAGNIHLPLSEIELVETLDEIQYGQFIRWLPLNIDDMSKLRLTRGGIIVDIKKIVFNELINLLKNNINT